MSSDETPGEKELLESRVLKALREIAVPRNCSKGQKLYFLGAKSYAVLVYDDGFHIEQPFQARQYDNIYGLIEEALRDQSCIGFVPVSEQMEHKLAEQIKLEPLFEEEGMFKIWR
jgi:hypothetical protein